MKSPFRSTIEVLAGRGVSQARHVAHSSLKALQIPDDVVATLIEAEARRDAMMPAKKCVEEPAITVNWTVTRH